MHDLNPTRPVNFFHVIRRYSLFAVLIYLTANQTCRAESPDLGTIPPDLCTPPVVEGSPAPGLRVRQTLPRYRETDIYHALYLPSNWEQGKSYPVIVEYAGNKYTSRYGDVSPGTVDGCNLGYGISGGSDFIWVCMPYINTREMKNETWWWGDVEATVRYCIEAVDNVCGAWGGDPSRLVITGFSRGAIACNYIGLHDDDIAGLWLAFIPFSHYDGVLEWDYTGGDRLSALERLERLDGRPTFICQEKSIEATKRYFGASGTTGDFTFQAIPFRNHSDTWVLRDIPARRILREWLGKVISSQQ